MPRRSYGLAPTKEAASGYKGRKIPWNCKIEVSFKGIKHIVSDGTLLNHTYWKTPFTVHTDDYYKQLGDVISKTNKPIELFSRWLFNPQLNLTMNDK